MPCTTKFTSLVGYIQDRWKQQKEKTLFIVQMMLAANGFGEAALYI